jgi:hypothetical protein
MITNKILLIYFLFYYLRIDNSQKHRLYDLEGFLKHNLDGLDLFSKLKVLKEILRIEENTPIDILNYIKRLNSFSNVCIAYRILLIIHVKVASAERSFSKLKLIKFYLRSTM